ncbi:hypothetical protein M3O37_19030, partial [Xanthomonas nasturtii]|nr:hypothetical protein [Xanthomonas nasturtii]MCL1536093.1 hypothetical protein [Xanthomonas nasturtii]
FICKQWTSEPDLFKVDPIHLMPGLNNYVPMWGFMRELSQDAQHGYAPARAGSLLAHPAPLMHTEALRRLAQPARRFAGQPEPMEN